jgi:uncharacterized protein (UPF0332 family)
MNPNDAEMIVGQMQKAYEKVAAARSLTRSGHHDDAISRAYYAMFHAASAVLLSLGITVDSHSALKAMFGLHLVKTGEIDREYGKSLSRLKDDRENGDYDIFADFDEDDAQKAIGQAQGFVAEMKRYLSQEKGIAFAPASEGLGG